MNQETIYDGDDILTIGDDDFVDIDALELDDYLIVDDPMSDEDDSWCVLFISGPFTDFVVRFTDVVFSSGTSEMTYRWTILSPSEDEDREFNMIELGNYCTSVLTKIMVEMHERKTNVYTDMTTGKAVDY